MRLTESQIGNLTNLLDVMFTEESASLAFAGKFGTDTLEELWNLRNSLYDHEEEETSEAWNPVDDDVDYSHYDPDHPVDDDEDCIYNEDDPYTDTEDFE
tara:strand:+ start:479 stop:775 length:297 start_codon:yes stop_codon:yes gene_type:complete